MQAAAGKRVLSSLASKLHPQLPLSPRESQQLLTLLTTSFRAHLDREHPLTLPSVDTSTTSPTPSATNGPSSYASATRHIDSILFNPLFVGARRASESAAVNALEDPLSWFVNEVARGAATLPKAALCLDVLETLRATSPKRLAAPVIVAWLETSGLINSKSFINYCVTQRGHGTKFLERLVRATLESPLHQLTPWNMFLRSTEKRVKETGLDSHSVLRFRQQLLARLVSIQAASVLNLGVTTFVRTWEMGRMRRYQDVNNTLRPAGAHLVSRITSTTEHSISPEIYKSFLESCSQWLGTWSPAVESMLWLHHPTERSALQGLQFIQSPSGALLHVQSGQGRRRFLVQLCLGVARQLMEQERYVDAQIAMEFSKEHFADMVLTKYPVASQEKTTTQRARTERENLELLDGLALS